jgi:hypothetical protein
LSKTCGTTPRGNASSALDVARLFGSAALVGERLDVACAAQLCEVRTCTSTLGVVQFSPRLHSRWDHFMWSECEGEQHWRMICNEQTVHVVGLRAAKTVRATPRAPAEAAFYFPFPPHAAYTHSGFPSQRITCGRGVMTMDFGADCDFFWRRMEADELGTVYGFELKKPFLCVRDDLAVGVHICDSIDCKTRRGVPLRRFIFCEGTGAEVWHNAHLLLWDGQSLYHVHRFPNMLLVGAQTSLRLLVDWDMFEMEAPFSMYRQDNLACTHLVDPFVASHNASYFCRLLNHYLCHRIGDYPWRDDATFQCYYNTLERDLTRVMPISNVFGSLAATA